MPEREIGHSLELKKPVTDIPSVTPQESDRDMAKRCAESSNDQFLVMESERGDDRQGPLTSQSKDALAQVPSMMVRSQETVGPHPSTHTAPIQQRD